MGEVDGNSGKSGIIPAIKRGVWGDSDSGYGVIGTSKGNIAVAGISNTTAVQGNSEGAEGVLGVGTNWWGVTGIGGHIGVQAISMNTNPDAPGTIPAGVEAMGDTGVLAYGDNYGISAFGKNIGIYAQYTAGINDIPAAYLGTQSVAGDFYNDIYVHGMITKLGGGFQIDHPLDPANKFLSHSFVESSDMKNIYDGVAVLNSDGKAEIKLPNWLDEINDDFRYQLTAIGRAGPNLYIEEEISKNRFKIAGGSPGMKVSWQVTGIRKDPWANSNRIKVEQKKSSKERGYYLNPELFNESSNKNIRWVRYPDEKQRLQKIKDMKEIKMGRIKDMKKKVMKVKMMNGKK